MSQCERCHGDGSVWELGRTLKCSPCKGTGTIAEPFDITKHKWQGGHEIRTATPYDDVVELNLYMRGEDEEVYIARDDAIAFAKHFKLTRDDLS